MITSIVAHPRILPSQFVEPLTQIQKGNMEFFMAVGMGLYSHIPPPRNTDFVVVISGDKCTPCKTIMPMMEPVKALMGQPQISAAWSGQVCSASPRPNLHLSSVPYVLKRCTKLNRCLAILIAVLYH